MQTEDLIAHLQRQPGKEVVLRVAGREHAIRGMYAAGSAVIIEAGEAITAGAAVAPQEALREAAQVTPMAEVVPDAVLTEGKDVAPASPGARRARVVDNAPQENQEGSSG